LYTEISQFEPLFPEKIGELEDLAVKVHAASARLEGRLSPLTLEGVKVLLRIVNSYYSNLIEGHNTHPIDIQRAMRKEYSEEDDKRDLQIESLVHIEVQKKIIERLRREPETNVAAPEFLLWLHREFYEEMPERLRVCKGEGDDDEWAWVEAGEFRKRQVVVGRHLPPVPESLDKFMRRFGEFYDPSKMRGLRPVIALVAAHHRLMWIHPFLDGNGRVARLFTDAYFYRINFPGYGLWNASRGLARRRKEYRAALAAADFPREGDLDGRGNLSDRTLTEFCRFFLETSLDQAEFMNSMLALDLFFERLERYVERLNAGLILDEKGRRYQPLPPRTTEILKEVAARGEVERGEIYKIVEMSESTGRRVLKSLFEVGLLVTETDWHRAPVRLGFPAQFAAQLFPNLFPEDAAGT
jgi:Fic family protein